MQEERGCYANAADWIEVVLGVETVGNPRNIGLLRESPDFPDGFDADFSNLTDF